MANTNNIGILASERLRKAGCLVNGHGDFVVKLASLEYGNEYNCYETIEKAYREFIVLAQEARRFHETDHIDREISVVLGVPLDLDDYWGPDEDEDEDE